MSSIQMDLIMDVTARSKEPIVEKNQQNGNIVETAVIEESEEAYSKNTDSIKSNTALLGEFGDVLPALIRNLAAMNMQIEKNNQLVPAKSTRTYLKAPEKSEATRNHETLMNFFRSGNNMVGQVANGNFGGAIVGGINTGANIANAGAGLARASELTNLAKGLAIAGGALAVGGLAVAGADKLADKYQSNMGDIFGTAKGFGITDNDAARKLYYSTNQLNRGTGLSDNDFQGVVQTLARQGFGGSGADGADGAMAAAGVAQNLSRWAYATGGDVQNYARLAGTMRRYGGSANVAEDMNYLMAAGKAQGLSDTQLPEFLDGIQKVMEDGIAKGFSRSATEVADTLTMFAKLSGNNPMWTGEQGARRLNQINSGIAGATALAKTEDILVMRAFQNVYNTEEKQRVAIEKNGGRYLKGASYSNMMQLIEKGIDSPDVYNSLMDVLDSQYGNDADAKVEALRSMTGLNYNGAISFLGLRDKKNLTGADIKNVTEAPENKNNETQLADIMSKLNSSLTYIGGTTFQAKMALMDGISSGVDKLVGHFVGDERTVEEKLIENEAGNAARDKWLEDTAEMLPKKTLEKTNGFFNIPDGYKISTFVEQFGGVAEGSDAANLILNNKEFKHAFMEARIDQKLDDNEIKGLKEIMQKILNQLSGGITMYKSK